MGAAGGAGNPHERGIAWRPGSTPVDAHDVDRWVPAVLHLEDDACGDAAGLDVRDGLV
jgi:hypothetical protein